MRYKYTDPETGEITERDVYFPRPHALIPVLDENGVSLSQWGRREGEDPEYKVPQTGWARLESLEKDYWQRFTPTNVLIPALEFCEKPKGFKRSAWYPPMLPGTYLQGLQLMKDGKAFTYVVTETPRIIYRDIDRVPVIVNEAFEIQDQLECDFEAAMATQIASKKKTQKGQIGLFEKP